jgi:hypothetical protein
MWRLIENGLTVRNEIKHRKIKDSLVPSKKKQRGLSDVRRGGELGYTVFLSCLHSAIAWNALHDLTGTEFAESLKQQTSHVKLIGWMLDWLGKSDADQLSWSSIMIYICGKLGTMQGSRRT